MLKINVNPIVLAKLKQSFPKPANRAKRALDKYCAVLENELNKSAQFGRTKYEILFNIRTLNLRELSQKGPQIGPNKQRLHAWLAENNLQFYEVIEIGSNLTGLLSKIKLNSLVTVTNLNFTADEKSIGEQIRAATTNAELDQVLEGDIERNREIFVNLYKDYYVYQTPAQRDAVFDRVPVDVKSLKAYIIWLNSKSSRINQKIIDARTEQAMEILSVAMHTGGDYWQRKKQSKFGRMYYSGSSVQNVSKDLRSAMLGDSWELDLRCSVVAFKLGFVKEVVAAYCPNHSHRRVFNSSLAYVENRDQFIKSLLKRVFGEDAELSEEKKFELLKTAFTAISFGARKNAVGWKMNNGDWKNPALKEILKSPVYFENFMSLPEVQSFFDEQDLLDFYLHELVKRDMPELLDQDFLKSGNKFSKAKLMAYLYQQCETVLMNFVRAWLMSINKPAIASIHDAVVVKRELVNGQLSDLNYFMRLEFGNDWLLLRQKKVDGYKRQSIEPEENFDFEFPSVEVLLGRLGYSNLEEYSLARKGVLYA